MINNQKSFPPQQDGRIYLTEQYIRQPYLLSIIYYPLKISRIQVIPHTIRLDVSQNTDIFWKSGTYFGGFLKPRQTLP